MKFETINKLAEENSKDIHEFFLASKLEIEKVKRRKKQFTISLVALCSFSLIGFVFVFLLWKNSEKLQHQIENTSKANAIATKAYTLLEHDPTLAFRLAEESYKIEPTPLNKQVIMAAYSQVPFYEKMEGHTDGLRNAIISPNGKFIVSGGKDNDFRIWDFKGKCLAILIGHKAPLINGTSTIAISAKNNLILTCSQDSTARLWNLKGECLAILKHNGPVNSVCFSPDDQKILTASSDKTARLWDLMGKEIAKMVHEKGVKKTIISPSGIDILSISDNYAKIYDLDGRKKFEFTFSEPIYCATYSNNGFLIALGGRKGTAAILDNNLKNIKILKGHNALIAEIDFHPKDSLIITSSDDLTQILWTQKGIPLHTYRGHASGIWSTVFSPIGKSFATASDDGTARIWDLEGNEIMLIKGHTSQVFSAQFSPDGKQIVTASGDKTARIWTIEPDENPIFKGHSGYVLDAEFSPEGKEIITAGWDYTARIWNINGHLKRIFRDHEHYAILQAKFLKDRIYTSTYGDGLVRAFNTNGKLQTKFPGHDGQINDIEFYSGLMISQSSGEEKTRIWSLDGKLIKIIGFSSGFSIYSDQFFSTFSSDSTLSFWQKQNNQDSISFQKVIQVSIPGTILNSAKFSPDTKWMATTSEDSTIRIWDMTEILGLFKNRKNTPIIKIGPEKIKHQIKLNAIVSSIVFSPKENIFISNSDDNIMRLWDIEGKQLAEFIGHSDGIENINFSPDGQLIVSGSLDKSVRLWDLRGNEIQNYPGHHHKVKKTKFSPDGKYILSCSNDHTARLMPVTIEQVLSKVNKEKVRGEVYKLSEQELKVYGVK